MAQIQSTPPLQPALFVPHGAPTFALRPGAAGAALSAMAQSLALPRAIVIVSAHWDTAVPTVGFAERPETIHDFWGFPDELYEIRYPATGCREASEEVVSALKSAGLPLATDAGRGLDHGAWVPLRLIFPDADVPVIPLSIQSRGGPEEAYKLGRALAPLRKQGVLIIGSGSMTHNLYEFRQGSAQPQAYAQEFAAWVRAAVAANARTPLINYRTEAPHAVRAHPTEEHFLPLLVALGAQQEGDALQVLDGGGILHGMLSMESYVWGIPQ